jgi:myo-inositol 2-dehydrogenase/D-chiro-inositol 1-dehydrogenase
MGRTGAVGIGLIGAGRIGQVHAANLARRVEGATLRGVADVRVDAAMTLASRYGVTLASDDYRDLLADPSVEAVIVASATDTHGEVVRAAAATGRHVFCEKPIDTTLAAIDASLEAVARSGVLFQVGFNRRFDPSFRRVRTLVASGEAGTPHLVCITSRDPQPPPAGYFTGDLGIFPDMTIHDFDLARYLVGAGPEGDEVVEVYATAASLVAPADGGNGEPDTAVSILQFASGAMATIDNSRRATYGYDQRAEVFGSGGMVSAGNVLEDQAVVANGRGIRGAVPQNFFLQRYADAYADEIEAFAAAVRSGGPSPVTGYDGRIAVAIAIAAQESVRQRRPVRLSEVR